MLRKIRIALAAVFFIGITLLFIGIGHDWWGWAAKLQFLPATMRLIGGATLGNIAVVCGILLLTLLVGRIYCSVICPLGVFQDIIIWLRRRLARLFPKWRKLRKRFQWSKERRVRYFIAVLTIAAIIADLQIVVALIGPYSAYGRMVRSIVGGGPAPLLIAAGVTFVLVVLCAWCWGRAWCNVICPVGSILGGVSTFQIFGVRIDQDKCIDCGACGRACKASCIQQESHSIDYSRCVDCFDCITNCSQRAISFGKTYRKTVAVSNVSVETTVDSVTPSQSSGGAETASVSGFCGRPWPHEWEGPADSENPWEGRSVAEESGGTCRAAEPVLCESNGRRHFIATGALLVGTGIAASAQNMKLDGGLAALEAKKALPREPRLVPPGAKGVDNFYDKCTACQLCITACPNGVLRTSTDLNHFLQPQMGYENGFCRPECTACSDVCPAGAIVRVTREEKAVIRIGTASVDPELCLAATGQERCGACASHCPAGAIMMVDADGQRRPVVAEEQCIGCGKCEYLCPVRPVSAITVKGLQTHISK